MAPDDAGQGPGGTETELGRLRRSLERERRARVEAESIAERGLRALYEKQQETLLLEAIAAAANEATSLRDTLQLAVDRICQYTGWPVGHVYFCNAGVSPALDLVPSTIWHVAHPTHFDAFRVLTEATPLAPGKGLPGRVAINGQPAWIRDVGTDSNFPRAAGAIEVGLRAACAFPVLTGPHVTAVLEFFSEATSEPNESLLGVMRQIGIQLGRVVERTRAQERLLYDAFHDHLTQLPNRALFMDRLQRAITRRTRYPRYTFAVLFVDLDRFKTVNDSLGHRVGDELLLEITRRLTGALRREDTVSRPAPGAGPEDTDNTLARLGGDEFTLLLEDIRHPSDAVRIAERIREVIAVPMNLGGQEVFASASIGIAVSTSVQGSGEDLVRDADIAMYRAKGLGGDRCAVFDATMHHRAVERLQLETDLRRALERHEFRLAYQPIVSFPDHRVIGFEALVRWQHPEQGELSPAAFLRVAEETGVMTRIDYWVLREACAAARQWQTRFPHDSPTSVSVNLSAHGFGRSDIVRQVADTLQETGLDPPILRLEITESVAMANAERARDILMDLRALGVRISLDDFGTGYSSLSYLQRFPVDTLKIDRSFVVGINQNEECREIIRTILNLAQSLGLEVIAEGTETAAQVHYLEGLGCRFGQGYFFSRPLPLDEIRALLLRGADDKDGVLILPKTASAS
jgi:predicted signal transduction protein with EAL and GGDEF domain